MAYPIGNEYYKIRSSDGRDRIFKTPEDLAKACNSYFQWVIENPFLEAEQLKARVTPIKNEDGTQTFPEPIVQLPKMRPMTLEGLCNYIDIAVNTFREYEKRNDFLHITTRVRQIIENHQFEGAASGFLNPNIIARKLGLVDKSDVTTGGQSMNPEERERRIQELLKKAKSE